jgi:hypothetical protein
MKWTKKKMYSLLCIYVCTYVYIYMYVCRQYISLRTYLRWASQIRPGKNEVFFIFLRDRIYLKTGRFVFKKFQILLLFHVNLFRFSSVGESAHLDLTNIGTSSEYAHSFTLTHCCSSQVCTGCVYSEEEPKYQRANNSRSENWLITRRTGV